MDDCEQFENLIDQQTFGSTQGRDGWIDILKDPEPIQIQQEEI